MEEDNKMPRLFMKPTSGDSNAKAELRAQQMRQTKRKEIREGLRTKLREYASHLKSTSETPRDI
jgi:DNA-directed RNA polymerase specialized sigma subunit